MVNTRVVVCCGTRCHQVGIPSIDEKYETSPGAATSGSGSGSGSAIFCRSAVSDSVGAAASGTAMRAPEPVGFPPDSLRSPA